MKYRLEELLPIVAKLAEKYTAYESTSITYEKAEQFMGAVIYCINETAIYNCYTIISAENITAQQAYDTGFKYVEEKTKKALELYNNISADFTDYDNDCLNDTFIKGLPEFFKWYDVKFEPQNTILTLDYPVLKNINMYTGIDKIYEFIKCIYLEQQFLNSFPKDYVTKVLLKYNPYPQNITDNICEIVLSAVIEHILIEQPLTKHHLNTQDYLKLQNIFTQNSIDDIKIQIKTSVTEFIQKYCSHCRELSEYLFNCVDGILLRKRLQYICS